MDRTRRFRCGKVEQFREIRCPRRRCEALLRLGDRREKGLLVEYLMRRRDGGFLVGIRDHDDRRAFQRGVGDPVDHACGARADAGQNDPGNARQFTRYRRHDRGGCFGAAQDEFDSLLRGRVDQIETRSPAGHAEDAFDTARRESGRDCSRQCRHVACGCRIQLIT